MKVIKKKMEKEIKNCNISKRKKEDKEKTKEKRPRKLNIGKK
jgi:hypothetical protein